uniref:Uncharacterized protein n=1 Tax=viral metagenome TaxID=1070528 RepID=A0A6C0LAE1_9ZZZZ
MSLVRNNQSNNHAHNQSWLLVLEDMPKLYHTVLEKQEANACRAYLGKNKVES